MKLNWYNSAQSNPGQMAKVRPPIAKRDKKRQTQTWHISDEKKAEEFELEKAS